jgi:hypothetical protein
LQGQLEDARRERNVELVLELGETIYIVENLSRQFFRWERSIERSLTAQELREIKKMPLGF